MPVKLTAFKNENGVFENMGTAIFYADGKNSKVRLRWPQTTSKVRSRHEFKSSGTELNVEGARDLAPEWRDELIKAHAIERSASGFDRKVAIDWQWPFLIPGENGIPELLVPVPGWRKALCWYEWHALGSIGKTSLKECSPGEVLSVAGIALGAVGYLTGYNHEKVDDTSSQYGSMGTGNDCDDFAVAAGAVANAAIMTRPGPDSCALHKWLYKNVKDVHVVSGYAWPNKKVDDNGRPIHVGHMWCELKLKTGREVIIECTSGVAFYGGTPVSNTVRVGDPEEYVSREFYWGANESHTSKQKMKRVKLPKWFKTLVYDAPSPTLDRTFKDPGPPPRGKLVYSSVPSRIRAIQGENVLQKKILPFTTGTVQFLLSPTGNDAASLTSQHGSFQ